MVSAASAAPTMTRSRRSRASNAASLIARVPAASGGVRPVVLVVDPVRLIEFDREAGGRRPERALPCLALLPDEASGQIDVDDVVLARDRVLQSITAALAHAVDAKRALAPAALDGDLLFQESDDLEGRSEQLPRHPTELPGEDLGQRLDLLVGGGGVDDEGGFPVALVNRLGPHEDPGALHAGEVGVAAAPLRHREADERAAAAVLRIREAAEVAATAEVAVAELVTLPAHLPTGLHRGRHGHLRERVRRTRLSVASLRRRVKRPLRDLRHLDLPTASRPTPRWYDARDRRQ